MSQPPQPPLSSSQAETPRTDEEVSSFPLKDQNGITWHDYVDADFARTLERELTALKLAHEVALNDIEELKDLAPTGAQALIQIAKLKRLDDEVEALKLANGKAQYALKQALSVASVHGSCSNYTQMLTDVINVSLPSTIYARYQQMEKALGEIYRIHKVEHCSIVGCKECLALNLATSALNDVKEGE